MRAQKSRRSASASVVTRQVTAPTAVTARRGNSLRLRSQDVTVRVPGALFSFVRLTLQHSEMEMAHVNARLQTRP